MQSYTFPGSVRLKKRAEFLRLANTPYKIGRKGFLVVWEYNSMATARLGVTVSKKVGCAVVRNRVKRYVREIFRHKRAMLPHVDLVVIARREAAVMDYFSVQRELEAVITSIGTQSCSKVSHSS